MNREQAHREAMAYHQTGPANFRVVRDAEALCRDAALKGIDVSPLITASDFHAEISRAITKHGRPWVSESRPRKARVYEAIKAVCLWLLLTATLFIVISAVFASAARADTADDWASVYGSAVCDTLDDYPTVSGLAGVLIGAQRAGGLTDEQAGEAVAVAVMTRCPEYRGLLAEFVRRYGPVVA